MQHIYSKDRKDATEFTRANNQKLRKEMDPEKLKIELLDVEDAKAHLILSLGDEVIQDEDGNVIYDPARTPVQKSGDFPDTVNPYLWQIKKDNEFAGVYKMAEGYYVVTGVEIAMVAFIRTAHGWIVEDCGNFVEGAKTAMKLAEKAIGKKIEGRIAAVIYSHSHLDHYAGAEAFLTQEQAGSLEEGKIPVIAPGPYEQSLIDDNLYAGTAMSRRLEYQGGMILPYRDEKGVVSAGLNHTLGIRGKMSMILPTMQIEEETTLTIDGVSLTFLPTPDTETRAHMCVYSNTHKVLFLGDNVMGTLHNTYTPRGARVRDAAEWGKMFYKLYARYGNEVNAVFQGHGIAHFKQENRPDNLKEFLLDNAAAYKFPNDQALLLANQGMKLNEIGRRIHIPDEIGRTWYTRDHYGNYTFNARGCVQRYLGFYDGNPVNLFPLEEQALAKKLVEYIGSEEKIIRLAEQDYEKGEYQWVATITNHLVFQNPDNEKARLLCADALEQLGYQAITGLWRNMYLCGAYELRHPEERKKRTQRYMENRDVMPYVNTSLLLDYLSINLDGEKALKENISFLLKISDTEETFLTQLYKGTLLYTQSLQEDPSLTVLTLSKSQLYALAAKEFSTESFSGSGEALRILKLLDEYVTDTDSFRNFAIVEP